MNSQRYRRTALGCWTRARILASSLLLLAVLPLVAQTNTGRILGSVHDQSDADLVEAKVVIVDRNTGMTRRVSTGKSGDFSAADLPPGNYTVIAEALGFERQQRPNIELQVGQDVRIDFTLHPGDVRETITISGDAPLIVSTNVVLGGTLSNKTINDLPLNGRDFQNLLVLRPGVTRYPGGGIGSVSSNGLRPEDNNYIVDGIDNNDAYYGQSVMNGSGVQGTLATILPIDAIQEFNVQENPAAEFGWKPGAIVNVSLKSGTNSLHGTAYYFARNAALDARNYFNTDPDRKKPLRLHQYGGTVGGAILPDKLFLFVGYEGARDLVGVTNVVSSPATVSLPTAKARNCAFLKTGDCASSIPDATADLEAGGFAISALSAKIALLFPANAGTSPQGSSILTTGFPNTNRGDNGVFKITYIGNERNLLSGTYFVGDSVQAEQDAPVLERQWESQAVTRAQVLGASWTVAANPRWILDSRFGYNRLNQSFLTADANVNPTAYGINTGVSDPLNFGMPQILIAGFLALGGTSGWPQLVEPAQTFQWIEDVSYTRGGHTVRTGGEIRRSSVDHAKDRFGKGRVSFNGKGTFQNASPLEDFLGGLPTLGRIFVGSSRRQASFWSYGLFLQDDWRVTPRMMVNLGLRYELNTVIKEAHNLLGNFDPELGLVQVGRDIPAPYDGDHSNFGPRGGVSWDLTGRSKTILRGGGGLLYEIPHFDVLIGQFNVNNDPGTIGINIIPTGADGVTPGGGTMTAGIKTVRSPGLAWTEAGPIFDTSPISCSAAVPCDIMSVARHLRTPVVGTWNVNIQHSFSNDLALQIAYVGNAGRKLYGITDINQILNQSAAEVACNHCEENSHRPYGIRFPYLGFINQVSNVYRSNYSGLQVTVNLRPYHAISLLAGYTWSHALDQASDNRAPQAMDSTRPRMEYGSSDFDMRHHVTLATTWAMPERRSRGQILEGWQMNSIVGLETGTPWNVVDTGSDFSATSEGSDRWNFFGNPADFHPTAHGPIPFAAGASDPACVARVTNGGQMSTLQTFGCYHHGGSVMLPPAQGSFGTMGRNIFRGPGLYDWDLSLIKKWAIGERVAAQVRGEFFNVLNHPSLSGPYGVNGTFFEVDPSVPNSFGCACATPDVAEANPVIGTGGPRNIQIGLKFSF